MGLLGNGLLIVSRELFVMGMAPNLHFTQAPAHHNGLQSFFMSWTKQVFPWTKQVFPWCPSKLALQGLAAGAADPATLLRAFSECFSMKPYNPLHRVWRRTQRTRPRCCACSLSFFQ